MLLMFVVMAQVLVVLSAVYLWCRNDRVHAFLYGILDEINVLCAADIQVDRPWKWRYEDFEAVDYSRFLFSFRRLRPENFWGDVSFLHSGDDIIRIFNHPTVNRLDSTNGKD